MRAVSSDTRPVDELSREELVGRIQQLEERVEQLENKEYLKALVRQVLHDFDRDVAQQYEEIELAPLPIQQIVRFPEDAAHEQLTATQLRARYV